ncbi:MULTISPECIES: VWA domain-containing protein [Thermomonospora]|uniref:von Willebrand factor type A n=1 Tax=Thermomonospora curvata (strain ATCC 19995 / DSM 43183 / JCM 3096 / KCTC 9072 / NBRC 15933 / NCIMB 10081 / Henssen B9) TaxID=471852 RepID=D1AEH2_THECD|nr:MULTISPECIES: VWA domain-containing protein [Thermomonospora]ACY95788.1 von Willebrand factor type A [Thermomonospora curvata DSM 43183]PKK16358.1 MAG: VWA domain-containing protein [Thermomonospora sp. CIF 1]
MPEFTIKVDQNRYLPVSGGEVHAIVTVEATGSSAPPGGGAAEAAEVIIIDTSGSMASDGKLAEAKRAARTAVDTLRDGVHFAVIAGFHRAEPVYPGGERLAVASASTKKEAKKAIGRLTSGGGTAIGSWLRMAHGLMSRQGAGGVRHAILLTDGQNQHETAEELDAALRAVSGSFVCDCRGVGTDWRVAELRKIASALLGSVDIVADPRDLAADFRAMTENAMGKTVADVTLRIWTPLHGTLKFIKQVSPALEDLTGKRTDSGPQTGDYPTGAWGEEIRDYHLCVQVPPGEVGRQMRAAWVKLVVPDGAGGERVAATGNVLAEWTDDEARSTRINPRVAHYTGQEELAEAIQEGLDARREGDLDTATARLGRAVQLARRAGNRQMEELLGNVVDVIDPVTGTVRLKKKVEKADEMSLETRSTKTVRTRKDGG